MAGLPKYIVHHVADISNKYSEITSDEQMDKWLKDGSLCEGDIVYSVSKACAVAPQNPKLVLKFLADHEGD